MEAAARWCGASESGGEGAIFLGTSPVCDSSRRAVSSYSCTADNSETEFGTHTVTERTARVHVYLVCSLLSVDCCDVQ